MVARERRVGRARGEHVRQVGMVGEGSWPRPEMRDDLVHGERHRGGGEGRRRRELPPWVAVGPGQQPQRDGRQGVQGDERVGERRDRILEPVARRDARVHGVEDRPVHTAHDRRDRCCGRVMRMRLASRGRGGCG